MTLRRVVAVTAIVTFLGAGAVTPRRVHAVDTAVLVISSIAAYAAFVALGAYLVFRDTPNPPLLPSETPADDDTAADGIRVRPGHRCAQRDGNVTVVCW